MNQLKVCVQNATQPTVCREHRETGTSSTSSDDIDADDDPGAEAGLLLSAAALHDRNRAVSVAIVSSATTAPGDVSCLASALSGLGHSVATLVANDTLAEQVRRARPALCFNLATAVSGPLGDAQVPSLLAMLGVPCVGAPATSLSLLRDRVAALRLLSDAGLPVAPFCEVCSPDAVSLRLPVAVRRSDAGLDSSAHTLATTEQALADALCVAGPYAVVEEALDPASARTLAVGVLGNRLLPPGGLYDTRGYHVFPPLQLLLQGEDVQQLVRPEPELVPEQACRISDIAIASVEALRLTDFARVDVQVDRACRVVRVVAVRVLPRVDITPFITPALGGLPVAQFVGALVFLALARRHASHSQRAPVDIATTAKLGSGGSSFNSPSPPQALVCPDPRRDPVSLAVETQRRQQQAVVEDDVDVVLSSALSTCDSPPLCPSPAGHHGPSLQQPQQHHTSAAPPRSYRKADVPPEKWNNWRWQLANRLTTAEQLRTLLPLTQEEEAAFNSSAPLFPVAVTPYFASLINPADPHDPIRLQVLPRVIESHRNSEDIEDSLGEDSHSPVPGVVHRYPDRILMLVSMTCASYCRFCTRNRVVGTRLQTGPAEPLSAYYERQLAYVRSMPQVRDVLLSGGDPLLLPMRTLDWLLSELRKIPHVEVVRIGSRVPIFVPQRVTPELCAMLAKHHPLWLNMHVNHPNELTPDSSAAIARLADAGIPLGSQTVMLAGINDCPNIIKALMQKLVMNRVRPYYLYQADLVVGAGHFRTPASKLYEALENLRGHTSGFAVPTACIDAPHGGGKVQLTPNYVISQNEHKMIVRNFEGFISTYTGPRVYQPHDPATCSYCRSPKGHGHQAGVAALLAGDAMMIKPEGWDAAHVHVAKGFSSSHSREGIPMHY